MSWSLVKLGELVDIKGGGTPSKKVEEYWNGSIPWASVKDFKCSLITETQDCITQEGVDNSATNVIPKGTLIVPTRMALGKVALTGRDMAINQDVKALLIKDKTKVCTAFLLRFLEHKAGFIEAQGQGATVKGIKLEVLRELDTPLPPLPEQKRIAAILDKADQLRQKRQQAIGLADEFLRSVFLDMFGDPMTNPKGWEVKHLKDVSRIQIGPFGTQLHKEDYIEGGIPLINPTHIVAGKIVPSSSLTISEEKHSDLTEYHLQVGDIIMGRRGEMGRCAVVGKKEAGWLCGTGSLFIRPDQAGFFSEYLHTLLSGKAIKSYLESSAQGVTMANLNKSIVGDIPIPIPSEKVIRKYSTVRSCIESVKHKYKVGDEVNLFNSLSQKAFSGEL